MISHASCLGTQQAGYAYAGEVAAIIWEIRAKNASASRARLGPRPISRGTELPTRSSTSRRPAGFNGAATDQSRNVGKQQHPRVAPHVASMGPRPIRRGTGARIDG